MSTIKSICEQVINSASLIREGKNISLEQGIDAQGILITSADKLARALLVLEEALNELKLGHVHAPDLSHIRPLGDTYGWCDYCLTRVSWGPGIAETALAQAEEILKDG